MSKLNNDYGEINRLAKPDKIITMSRNNKNNQINILNILAVIVIILILSNMFITSRPDSVMSKTLKNNKGNLVRKKVPHFSDRSIMTSDPRYIQVAVIVHQLSVNNLPSYKLRLNFRNLMRSLILRTRQKPVRFIFMTDSGSMEGIETIIEEESPPYTLTSDILDDENKKATVNRFSWEFVDLEEIIAFIEPKTKAIQDFFNNPEFSYTITDFDKNKTYVYANSPRYNSTFYSISPFYHEVFPQMSNLIVLDADIEFHSDIYVLWNQFQQFDEQELFGVANDLSPNYHQMTTGYRERNPRTRIGMPGQYQGLNVGVMLLKLDKIRKSEAYQFASTEEGTAKLAYKFGLTNSNLGAQDWFTLVSWNNTELWYPLPCEFNRQLGTDFDMEPWKEIFPLFHRCKAETEKRPVFVIHGNSDSNL